MWRILFVLTFTAGHLLANEDCNEIPFYRCSQYDFTLYFPHNEKEVITLCDSLKSKTECALQHMENCGGVEKEILEFRSMVSYLEENCQVNSSIYQSAVTSLECIEPIFSKENLECTKTDDEKAMKFFMYLMELSERGIKDATDDENDKMKCLDALYKDACTAAEVGRTCGHVARNTVVDVFQNLDSNLKACKKEIIEDMINLVHMFQSD